MDSKEELTAEEVERRLKLAILKFKLTVMERMQEAGEKGDYETASRWLNLLNSVRNLVMKIDD
jgi:hypothetical protein